MKTNKLFKLVIVAALAVSSALVTGCNGTGETGETNMSNTITDSTQQYCFIAKCKGGDVVAGHNNTITLTDVPSSAVNKMLSVNDFYINIKSANLTNLRVTTVGDSKWSVKPVKGGTTKVTKLFSQYADTSVKGYADGEIKWITLDLDKDTNYEGEAEFKVTKTY